MSLSFSDLVKRAPKTKTNRPRRRRKGPGETFQTFCRSIQWIIKEDRNPMINHSGFRSGQSAHHMNNHNNAIFGFFTLYAVWYDMVSINVHWLWDKVGLIYRLFRQYRGSASSSVCRCYQSHLSLVPTEASLSIANIQFGIIMNYELLCAMYNSRRTSISANIEPGSHAIYKPSGQI